MATSKAKLKAETPQAMDEALPESIVAGARGHWLAAAGLFVVLVGLWEAACRALDIAPHMLPAPSAIGVELYDNFRVLLHHTWVTTIEVVVGFVIAAIVGVALAMLVDRSAWLRAIIHPYVIVLQATPKVALAPFLIIWFGFGITSKIAMAALITFFPIFVNTVAGFVAIGPRLLALSQQVRSRAGGSVRPDFSDATLHLVVNLVTSTILQCVLDPPADVTRRALLLELSRRVEEWIRGPRQGRASSPLRRRPTSR